MTINPDACEVFEGRICAPIRVPQGQERYL